MTNLNIKSYEAVIFKNDKLHCITRKDKAKELVKLLAQCFEGKFTIEKIKEGKT